MKVKTEKIGLKLASALLLYHGEISVSDIQSMPFFTNPEQIENVIISLMRTFNARIDTKQVATLPFPEWEQVIKLIPS